MLTLRTITTVATTAVGMGTATEEAVIAVAALRMAISHLRQAQWIRGHRTCLPMGPHKTAATSSLTDALLAW